MVRGCVDWQAHRLQVAGAVFEATADYRAESDLLGLFLAERCVLDKELSASSSSLFAAYREWSEEKGEAAGMTQNRFGRDLHARGLESFRSSVTGKRLYRGVGIKISAPVNAPAVTGSWNDG